jgi:hypothetical protein
MKLLVAKQPKMDQRPQCKANPPESTTGKSLEIKCTNKHFLNRTSKDLKVMHELINGTASI